MLKPQKSLFVAVMVALVAILGYAGYSITQNNVPPVSVTQEQQEFITVKHAQGETVVPVNPKKIVVLDFGVLDTLDSIGVRPEELCTPVSYIPKYLKPVLDKQTTIDAGKMKEPNLETIASAKPDLIIMSGRQQPYYDKLAEIAPTINLSVSNEGYMDALHKQMNILGKIFKSEEKAEMRYQALFAKVMETKQLAQQSGKKSLMIITVGNKINAYGPGMRFGFLYDDTSLQLPTVMEKSESVGVKSPGGKVISYEYIKERNPDYILVIDRNAATNQGGVSAKDLFDVDILKSTNAYKNNKIIYVTPDLWYLANNGYTGTLMMLDEIQAAIK